MRSTLHLVSAADYRALWPAVRPDARGACAARIALEPPTPGDWSARCGAVAAAFAAEPRTPDRAARPRRATSTAVPADEVVWWLRRRHPLAHAPTGGPWSFGRRPLLADADAWLAPGDWAGSGAAIEHLVRRYLGAFGPATIADIARWSGVAGRGASAPASKRSSAAGDLRRYRSETRPRAGRPRRRAAARRGRPGAAATAADVGQHRARLRRPDADRQRRRSGAGSSPATAIRCRSSWSTASWRDAGGRSPMAAADDGSSSSRSAGSPASIGRRSRQLGDRLAQFVEPNEPNVYARYQRWRKDDAMTSIEEHARAAVRPRDEQRRGRPVPVRGAGRRRRWGRGGHRDGCQHLRRDADPAAHGEVEAIRAACRRLGTLRPVAARSSSRAAIRARSARRSPG